jgi:hypothetical protein
MIRSTTNAAAPEEDSPSQAKIEANRRNGFKSPGPRTQKGKAAAKGNALKYGLYSSQVVIERIDGEGARERFAALQKSLRQQFAPLDPVAEFRAQRVAANLWRLDRHDRAEAAMLENAQLRAAQDELLRRFRLPGILDEDIPGTTATTEPKSQRIRFLIGRLIKLEEEVQRDGGLSAESLSDMMKLFGTSDPFAVECAVLCVTANATDAASNEPSDAHSPTTRTSLIKQATQLISEKRHQLRELEQDLERNEQLQRAAHLATLCVPSAVDFEKLWRSRAAINKELEQDLAYLSNRPRQGKKSVSM